MPANGMPLATATAAPLASSSGRAGLLALLVIAAVVIPVGRAEARTRPGYHSSHRHSPRLASHRHHSHRHQVHRYQARHARAPSHKNGYHRAHRHKTHGQKARTIRANARLGDRRERQVQRHLKWRHPLSSVQAELYLRDRHGHKLVDRRTGQARRFDFAVVTPTGNIKRLVEVTSKTADKREQHAKTERLLAGHRKVYVQDRRTGELRPVKLRGLLGKTRIETVRLR